ncbi:MAG TPA: FtsW/RodA/SpoVE family cell cycle protein [Gaiellaceae bacterium]|nr:FtsW/RodA/SpoVE family cell cycle protein [Gaiellaceae bacterium]
MGARPLTGLRPRNRELIYLAAVGVLTGLGFASVYIARQALVSWGSLGYALFFFALYLAAHVMARVVVPEADPYLLPMAGLLTAIGVTEIYRLGPNDAFKQGLWIVIGVALFAVALFGLRHDYRRLEDYKYLFGIGAIALLFLPRVPGIGTTVNGARLWVRVGPMEVQPGEFAKIFLIVFLAAYLREKREVLAQGRLKDMGPLLVIWGGCMLVLVSSNDLGSALLYFGIFLSMLYVATARLSFVVVGIALFVAGGVGAYEKIPHVRERVTIWLHPWTSSKVYCPSTGTYALRQDCASYQLVKSLYSIANGGFGGAGLGKGTFTTTDGKALIPYVNSDFIYSALAQELGLIGAAALLLVFMLFVARGMKIALQGDDGFSKLLAAGLTFGFGLQTFIIVGGVLRIIPLTGITLPFVSYGGSSVVANFLLLAGLLLVSNRANST